MTVVQALTTLNSILALAEQLAAQMPTTSGGKLLILTQGVQNLLKKAQDLIGMLRPVLDQETELTDEQIAQVKELDDAAAQVQRAALEAADAQPTEEERAEARGNARKGRKRASE
jgi:hypothetical protein